MGEKKQVQGNVEKDLFPWAPAERKLALPFAGNPGTREKGLEDLKNAHPAKLRCHRGRKNTLLRVRSACLMRWSPQWKARWCGSVLCIRWLVRPYVTLEKEKSPCLKSSCREEVNYKILTVKNLEKQSNILGSNNFVELC